MKTSSSRRGQRECRFINRISPSAENCEARYSLIVIILLTLNPGVACATPARDSARATGSLDHQTLLRCAAALIEEEDFLCGLTRSDRAQVIALAQLTLALRFRFDVAEYAHRPPHRVLLGFSPSPGETLFERLAIRDADRQYSDAWQSLTRDFYLFMS